ncbi:unnamed protein product [Candida verbasci]|uniref:Uncharacterized protein n=1 Tax=Candida verbasci TaxID=1227364 RepID=A0A9W4U1Y5_9ASCO|nr:unnamed protein product [Candida verbasci]
MNNEISCLNEDKFKPVTPYGPITAIKIHNNYIYVGYGSLLKIYNIETQESVFQTQVFKRRKIHSIDISPNGESVLLSGEKSFMVANLSDLFEEKAEYIEKSIHEWIITSCFSDDSTILLLNAYNNVYQINLSDYTYEKIHCNEKSILYSGSINILNDGEIYIAAGTVMNGVVIWNLKTRKIVYNLKDHEGSIFGVKIDQTGKFIISCSDDRSIKLYDFRTGNLLANGWGHGSRIWGLSFFKSENDKIMSIGEDCTLRIWKFDGTDQLVQLRLYENCHRGKHIWSGDVDDDICVTGGADGKLRIHDLNEDNQNVEKYSIDEISETCQFDLMKNEFIRDFYELETCLILLTSNGHLIKFEKEIKEFRYMGHYSTLINFGIVKGFKELGIVVIADRQGDLLVTDGDRTEWIDSKINRTISNIFTYSQEHQYFILMDCPNPNIPYILYKFNDSFNIVEVKEVPKPEKFITISSIALDLENNWLVLATKKITIGIIDLNSMESKVFRRISQGDTISQISIINPSKNNLDLLILARDGIYTYLRTNLSSIEIYQQNKLTRGFIEGGSIQNNELILYGFKSSYFYVWNETRQIEIMNQYCGGNGHRQYKFIKQNNGFRFIYNFKNYLCICEFQHRFKDYGLINQGTHGREIRDLSIGENGLLAIIAEDSTISLNKIINGGVKHYWSMNNHISGMQRIKFMNENYLGSSAANEEFIIWKLNSMDDIPTIYEVARLEKTKDVPDLRIMDFDSIEITSDTFMIATVYSDSQIKIWNYNKGFNLISKWIYKSCCVLNVQFCTFGDVVYLLIATTDGFISVYKLTNDYKNHSVVLRTQLHQSSIKAINLYKRDDDHYILITGGDDNAITVNALNQKGDVLSIDLIDRDEFAASSTITSISKVNDTEFVVTSVDQIVRLWSFKDTTLKCNAEKFTTVADTGCSDITEINNEKILVIGGAGLSLWNL